MVAQDQEQNQTLNVDNRKRYLVNHTKEWQWLFGPGSSFSNGERVLKIAAEFDTADLSSVRLASYLFNTVSGGTDSLGSCSFRVYTVTTPAWTETLVHTVSGSLQYNGYWYADVNLTALTPAILDGDPTLAIDVIATRLGETFRDRIYVNHLGVYDSIVRLRADVEYLDLTKQDE